MSRNVKGYVSASLLIVGLMTSWGYSVQAERRNPQSRASTDEAGLLAVRTTAQWCKVCSAAKDSFADVTRQLRGEPVLFITLDRTDEFSSRQAAYLAAALDIRGAIPAGPSRVGELLLINARSQELISTTELTPSSDTMSTTIRKALALVR